MKVVRQRGDEARNGLLLGEGRKWKRVVFMNSKGLTVTQLPLATELVELEAPSVDVAIKHFRAAARKLGCTKEVALAIGLKRAIKPPRDEKPPREKRPKAKRATKAAQPKIASTRVGRTMMTDDQVEDVLKKMYPDHASLDERWTIALKRFRDLGHKCSRKRFQPIYERFARP